MKLLNSTLVTSIYIFLCCHFILPGNAEGDVVTIFVSNKCPFTVWPATAPNTGHPVLADGGFTLASGQTRRVNAPPAWSGRIWARTGCNFGSHWPKACQTGDCDGRLACNGLIGLPPATLVELTLSPDPNKPTNFYDVSLVDGYNVPVSVTSKPVAPGCSIAGCSKNMNAACPEELKVRNDEGEVVACKSACLAFDLDVFCCRNAYGSPDKCKPSMYSKMFKDACPSYFSYAFDSPTPLIKCSSKELVLTFCPSKWGHEQDEMPLDVAT